MKNMPILLSGLLLMWSSEVLAQTAQPVLVSDTHSLTKTAAANLPDAPAPANNSPAPGVLVRSTVQVNAQEQTNTAGRNAPEPFHATAAEILSSAGTYGDFSRYLQLFPGVVFNSDESDDVLVRGGNPIENLYMLDGIEVPNINHIATGATTGGLVSMIDTAAISGLDFQTGGYDASYEERLSSIINIQSREPVGQLPVMEGDVGVFGVGFVRDTPLPNNGSLLFSAHRSLLSLFTDDIGLNGVPIYTNSLI